MKLFKREKIEDTSAVEDKRAVLSAEGLNKMMENGFLVENPQVDDGYLYDGRISIRSEMFSFIHGVIQGDDDENIEKLARFYKKNIVKQIYARKGDGPVSFNLGALVDISAFIIGNRDLDANDPVYIDCIKEGIEITCKAAPPEKRTCTYADYLMRNSLQDAIAACGENGNGYPIITYDEETGELTAAIFLPEKFDELVQGEDVIKSVKDVERNTFRDKKIKYLNKDY